MILTCPNCATGFFVDDHLIGRDGRQVKCDECGEVWTAHAEEPAAEPPEDAAETSAASMIITPEPAPDVPMFAPQKTPPAPPRGPTPARRRLRLLIALLIPAAVIGALIAFQGAIVKVAPATGGVYRALGLTAPTLPGPAAHVSPHG